jgi:hypothetical protein
MSDAGVIFSPWVFALIGLAVVAALLARVRSVLELGLAGVVLLACAATALFEGTGHKASVFDIDLLPARQ